MFPCGCICGGRLGAGAGGGAAGAGTGALACGGAMPGIPLVWGVFHCAGRVGMAGGGCGVGWKAGAFCNIAGLIGAFRVEESVLVSAIYSTRAAVAARFWKKLAVAVCPACVVW